MKHIGVFGGSFNPIHNGHIALARQIREECAMDEVWFLVSPQNPLKDETSLLDESLRLSLAQEALRGEAHLKASDYEFRLPRPSFTWDTLTSLTRDYPQHIFTLIIGSDNWTLFPRWHRAGDILRHFRIAIYPRRGDAICQEQLPEGVRLVRADLLDISSTQIRERARKGLDVSGLVPQAIEEKVRLLYGKQ